MKIPAGKFKAHCLQIMDEVKETRNEVTVTKRGEPVVRLVPCAAPEEHERPIFGFLQGQIQVNGNILEPIAEAWDADT